MNKRIKKKKYKQALNFHTTKKQRDKNKALCKRYPFLILRNVWDDKVCWLNRPYDCTLFEEFPKGWRKAFVLQLCEELREELIRCNYLHKFRLTQIKEKYGELKIYFGAVPIDCEVSQIIDDYTTLSGNICERCGKPDIPMLDWRGWFTAICEDCYNKIQKRNERNYGHKPIPYSHWEASESRMVDERKYTICYRKPMMLDIGNWNEYVQIYDELKEKDNFRINNKGEITKYISEPHTRDLRDKAEKIRARWRTR